MKRAESYTGPLLIALCAFSLIAQVLLRPAVGIANNGDFAKMAGVVGVGPEDGNWFTHDQHDDFLYRYVKADRYFYNKVRFREAEFISSEFFFVKISRAIQKFLRPGDQFDIRFLGAIHGLLYLAAIAIWIYALPPSWRLFIGPVVVLVWTDVVHVQFLNSFYMDTAAIIFALLAAAIGLWVVRDLDGWAAPLIMIGAVTALAVSKSQHALASAIFVPLFLSFAVMSRKNWSRLLWAAGSLVVTSGIVLMLRWDTEQYRSIGLFNMIFLKLAPQSSDPLRTLQELGLGEGELRFLNTHAYFPNSPMADPEWIRTFNKRCSHLTLLRYCAKHPSFLFPYLYDELSRDAPEMLEYANRSTDDGFSINTISADFGHWSRLRMAALRQAPWHLPVMLLVGLASAVFLCFRSSGDRPIAMLFVAFECFISVEFLGSVLADAAETPRHLKLFNVGTDILILLLPLLLAKVYQLLRRPQLVTQW